VVGSREAGKKSLSIRIEQYLGFYYVCLNVEEAGTFMKKNSLSFLGRWGLIVCPEQGLLSLLCKIKSIFNGNA
jgi:hypothetical protein